MANKKDYEMLRSLRDELNDILADAPAEDTAKKTNKKTTAPAAEDDLDGMAYNDLKKLCKSRGLSAAGNREELIARLNGEVDDDEGEDDEPVKKPTKGAKGKKSVPVEEEDDEDEDDDSDEDEDDDDDEEDVQAAVEAATEDMSLEDLAEFCEDNGLSSKGKRQALIARIVKAVEAGDIELSDDEDEEDDEEEEEKPAPKSKKGSAKPDTKKTSKKKQEEEDEDDDDEEEGEPTKERIAALKAYDKDTRAQFKKGEIERDDLVEFLCDFHDKDKKTYKKLSDKEVLDAYIEASSMLINDEGDIVEEGAYTVNGTPHCCGRPLSYNEDDEQYVCEHCGGEYEADEE